MGLLKQSTETDQQKRDRIVKQAKDDIERLIDGIGSSTKRKGYRGSGEIICDADFKINKKKRVVVCLLRWQIGGFISQKGIAKCALNDCFNVHIGKSIALHRALGLDVPQEYLDVPNPTEVRVGNVIDVLCIESGNFIKSHKVVGFRDVYGKTYPTSACGNYAYRYRISDDSESDLNV